MKRTARLLSVVAVSVLLAAGGRFGAAAEEAKAPQRGEAAAVIVEKGPALDGTMDDALWQKCPAWPMGECTSQSAQKHKTWAKVLFDPTHVYVGVWCEEPDTGGLVMKHTRRDEPVYMDDSIEVFLRADPQQPACQFVVNPRGTLYDARDKQASWNSSAEAKASIREGKSWTATLKVPLKELSAYVGGEQIWTMNVYRTRPARGGDPVLMTSWSVMSEADYHAALEFGIVTGIEVPKRPDGVTRVRPAGAPRPTVRNRGVESGGVTIYHKMTFDQSNEGWQPGNGAKLSLTGDAADGKALHVACAEGWSACELPVSIVGSRELKIALSMKGHQIESTGINVYDAIARDNTTAYGYRYFRAGRFTPMLYYLDRFRYNSETTGFVSPNTNYTSVRLYCPAEIEPGTWFALDDFVVYRGTDQQPPAQVTGLTARATARGVELRWNRADDNVASQGYVISRADGGGSFRKIAEGDTTSYLDATAGKATYRYRVFAVDFEENLGPWSDPVPVRSNAVPRQQKPTREEQDRLGYADHVRQVHARGEGKVRKNHATLFGDSLTGATVYPHCARSAFGTMTVNARGYPSMRTSFGRDKVEEILRQDNPEVMFILYGTNNNKAEEHFPAAMDDLAAICRACEARGTVAVLGTIPPRGWTPESAPEAGFNRHVVELCRKLKIPTGYIFETFQAAGPENRRTYMGGDGVHWTGDGMALGGQAWGKALRQIRFVVRDRR